jgi:CheY-like chemotaxis protein
MSKKVFIIDDDPDSISFLRCILKAHDYDTIWSLSSATAIAMARSEKPDLILLDLLMPEKSGIRLFKELRKDPELQHIPVVIMSNMPQVASDLSTLIGRHSDPSLNSVGPRPNSPEGLMEKPIEPDLLTRTIQKILNEGDMWKNENRKTRTESVR